MSGAADVRVEGSQGDGLQLSTERFDDLQKALGNVKADADRLRKMCADYRAQRSELESILDTLKADVDRLKSEKEDARIELVSEKEAIAWWAHREEAASSNKVSSAGAIRDIRSKAETAGRAIRKAHVFEGKVKEAEVRYQALEVKHQENLEEERAVASGLRDRIGRLEGRLRVAEKAKTDSEAALEREKKERAEEAEGWKVKEETWVSEKRDLLQLRDDLKGKLESAEARVRAVPQEDPSEAVVAQQRAAARPLTPLQTNRPIPTTPSRRSPSSKSTAPTTPISLARRLAYMEDRHRALQADYDKIRSQHEADRKSWKEWKYAHMARQDEKKAKRAKRRQERIRLDNAEEEGMWGRDAGGASSASAGPSGADRGMPTQGNAAAALAVVEASQESGVQPGQTGDADRTRGPRSSEGSVDESLDVERQASRGQQNVQLDVPLEEQETVELPEWNTQAEVADQPPDLAGDVIDVACETDRLVQQAAPSRPPPPEEQHRENPGVSPIRPTTHSTPRLVPQTSIVSHPRSTSPAKQVQTPQAGPPHVIQATRTTPWLGKAPLGRTTSASASHRSNVLQTMDDDIFASPPEMATNGIDQHHFAPIPTFSNTTPAKLLVRDRTGRTPGNALLRSALQSRPAGATGTGGTGADDAETTPSRSAAAGRVGHTPLSRSASGSTSRLSGRIDITAPGPHSSTAGRKHAGGGKRKIDQVDLAEVDFADIEPEERARYLKTLGHLRGAKRTAVYSGFKGHGRYMPPDQLQKGIADEYEIDPKLNDGQTHQYHDVKRKRSERKQMHGGDCECCRGYYEAVGPLPRYNQAPKWNDARDDPRADAGGVHHHQQLVSRHRETWQQGGTPPGYWSIGFPTSQDAEEQNRLAEQMTREKEARIRREAETGNGKYRKKAGV